MRISTTLSLVVIAIALFGCSKSDPLYCDPDTPCRDPDLPYCDLEGEFPASDGIGRTCIAQPDFAVSLASADGQVRIGDELAVEVDVDRIDDFPIDIVVEATGLPSGATADPLTIPGDAASGTLTIHGGDADAGAVAMLTITATASPAAGPIEHSADLHLLVLGPAGSLDPTFGSNGLAGQPPEANMDDAIALMQVDDGSIIVGGPTPSGGEEAVLVRYTSDGELDTSFGSGGTKHIAFDGAGIASNGSIQFGQQSDGKVVIAVGSDSGDIALARLDANGDLDPSFAGGGIEMVQVAGGLTIRVDAIGVGVGDEIAIGMATNGSEQLSIVRFDRDGNKDLSFASGRFDLDLGHSHVVTSVHVFGDGSMLVSGTAFEPDPPATSFLLRLTLTGVFDSSFGNGGQLAEGMPRLVDTDGSMLFVSAVDDQAVFRQLSPSGDPDADFGDGGQLSVTVPAGWITPIALLPGAAGLLAVGGPDITLSRFDLSQGSLDQTFGTVGVATVPLEDTRAVRALRQADGRIVVLADGDGFPFALARFFE